MNTYQITIQTDSNLTVATVTRNEESVTYNLHNWKDGEEATAAFEACAEELARIDKSRNDFDDRVKAYYANPLSVESINRLFGIGGNNILALFSPDEECTTFYAHVICYPNEPALLGYPTTDENAAKTSAVCEFCNGHVVAIHIPNRLLQPRAATVTECKAEEAK